MDNLDSDSQYGSTPSITKGPEDDAFIESDVFNDEKGEKIDEDDANSEMDQGDIHNDEKWDTDIEQEGFCFNFINTFHMCVPLLLIQNDVINFNGDLKFTLNVCVDIF